MTPSSIPWPFDRVESAQTIATSASEETLGRLASQLLRAGFELMQRQERHMLGQHLIQMHFHKDGVHAVLQMSAEDGIELISTQEQMAVLLGLVDGLAGA